LAPGHADTIYALASGFGKSAIAVLRVSGPGSAAAARALLGRELPDRQAALAPLRHPGSGELIDRVIAIHFAAPRSYTGENMLELHVTGGRAVVKDALAALAALKSFRPAQPGEFALRAFENGKVDLTEVEGLADLVEAETSAQRRQAVRIAGGALTQEADTIRTNVLKAMASVDALIDFSDIDDAEDYALPEFRARIRDARGKIRAALDGSLGIAKLREGYNVVLAGAPNAGKSTLMNALTRQETSIVSAIPGTTRDAIEVALDLGGYPVVLVDTAGIREAGDAIEAEGVRRALKRVENADLVLWLSETGDFALPPEIGAAQTFKVRTKADLLPGSAGELCVSGLTGAGIAELIAAIRLSAETALEPASHSLLTRERHRAAFLAADAALARALQIGLDSPELAGEELRRAAGELERVAGRIGVEDVLDEIFSSLCVGK
jgi:tRNA modification GTPase